MADIFNQEVATKALDLTLPGISQILKSGATKRSDLHIIVGNNAGEVLATVSIHDGEFNFEAEVYEEWEHPYHEIAQSKFEISVRTGQPTRLVINTTPELAGKSGDTVYWGSAIDGGIVVACSGVQPYWDEAISKMVAAAVRALVTESHQEQLSSGKNFIS